MPNRSETSRIIATGIPFSQLPHACTLDTNVTNAAFRVYALLMKLATSEGRAWPGHRYIADVLPITRPTVKRALTNLETTGWVTVDRSRQAHQYYVHGELQTLPFPTGKETLPVTKVDRTGKETLPELVTKLDHTDNQDRQPSTDNHLATVDLPHGYLTTVMYRTAMKDALVAAMDWHPKELTRRQWSKVEVAAKELCDICADPGDVWFRAQVYQVNFAGATMTPNAIATNWADLATPREPIPARQVKRAAARAQSRAALAKLGEGE